MPDILSTATQNLAVPTIIAVTSIQNPYLAVLMTFFYGLAATINIWQQKRGQEVLDNVGAQRIVNLIQRDDKTRDTLHRIMTNVVNEPSDRKRKLFYNYIKNFEKDVHPEFDYHTKLIVTLNSMTFEELDVLIALNSSLDEIKQKSGQTDQTYGLPNGVSVSTLKNHQAFANMNERTFEALLVTLGNYNTILVGFGTLGGTTFGPVTEFGKIFLDYVSSSED